MKLSESGPNHCRWVIGDSREAIICGDKTTLDSSWCPHHWHICHDKPKSHAESMQPVTAHRVGNGVVVLPV